MDRRKAGLNVRPTHELIAAALLVLAVAAGAEAGSKKKEKQVDTTVAPAAVVSDNYDELFVRYLQAARATVPTSGPRIDWMSSLGADFRARSVNDLVTVQVIESIVGTGTADSNLDKKSSGNAAVTNLFGLESKYPSWLDPTNIVNTTSETEFKGGGKTTRASTLTAMMTARVTEVLPNGDLVLEGAREIEINGDRQIVVLTGVVKPNSLSQNNIVPSTLIGQLRIRYFGRGLIKDNLRPGILIRILNKIF
jgi:flagellar L-ring protein precursor FlgH